MTTPLPAGSLRATSLNAARRRTELAAVADGAVLDVLVVGGGVVGAGVALDAASRGLSVCLVEARDIAFGTSRWSSNLVHGGLRHLINGDFALARLNAVERGVLMTRTAPHLVHALPTLYPQYQAKLGRSGPPPAEVAVAAGLRADDALRRLARTPSAVLPPPRHVPTAEALALVPGLRAGGLRGGTLTFAGRLVDDARLVCALARTAAGFGARVLTRVRATRLHGDGADVVDELTGTGFSVRAHAVINATGVWADELQDSVRLRHWLGTHLVLDAEAVGLAGTALTATTVVAKRPKLVSLTPQQDGLVYLGVADQPVDYHDRPVPEAPEPPQSDVDFLLDVGSSVLDRRLRRDHVLGAFAGVGARLEAADRAADSAGGWPGRQAASRAAEWFGTQVSGRVSSRVGARGHRVVTAPDGVVTVLGSELTTYRRMAEDAVDTAIEARQLAAGPSRTTDIPLVGAGHQSQLSTVDAPARLVARYGMEAGRIAALAELDPDMADPISARSGITAAEVVWAVRHEGALSAEDVLDRRTRIGLVAADRAAAEAEVTELVAKALDGLLAT